MSDDPKLKDADGNAFRVLSDTITHHDGAPLSNDAEAQAMELVTRDGSSTTTVGEGNPLDTVDQAAVDKLTALLTAVGALATDAHAASILAALGPAATAGRQDTANTVLSAIATLLTTQGTYLDGLESNTGALATQTTAAAVLAKLSADPATQTTLTAVLAKLTSDPSTAAAQATQSTKLDTVHTDLAAILTKLIASPATETTLASIAALLTTQAGYLDGVETALAAKLNTKQTGVAPPLGYGQNATLTTVSALPTIPGSSVTALVIPRGAIRWRDDGTNPTASVGMYLAADQPLSYQGSLAAFRMVAVTGSVEVNVSFYGAEA